MAKATTTEITEQCRRRRPCRWHFSNTLPLLAPLTARPLAVQGPPAMALQLLLATRTQSSHQFCWTGTHCKTSTATRCPQSWSGSAFQPAAKPSSKEQRLLNLRFPVSLSWVAQRVAAKYLGCASLYTSAGGRSRDGLSCVHLLTNACTSTYYALGD